LSLSVALDLLQWPAMLATAVAAWAVGSSAPRRRQHGFWCFILSNVLWIAWGIAANAFAVELLQFVLAALNIRGAHRAEEATNPAGSEQR
jgi:lipopolysaccharide export LptBFGC system permease protein LptF